MCGFLMQQLFLSIITFYHQIARVYACGCVRVCRFDTDMFSSAALIVTPGGNPENAQVYISTTKGGIYCYNAMTVSNGPLWNTYGEIGRVPDSVSAALSRM